jgi:HKD family nuclease
VLTTDYMNITEAYALARLLDLSELDAIRLPIVYE